MSKETMEDLNTNILVGNTDQRGSGPGWKAWWYKKSLEGALPNHFAGFVPVQAVRDRLFYWNAVSRRMAMEIPADLETMTHLSDTGEPMRWAVQEDLQGVARDDNHHRMGVFTEGYEKHQYDQWLLTEVANILDDGLGITSAGLLQKGAIAWVEVGVPDTITTPEGVDYRPNLLATTSFNGSISTTYKRTVTCTICDNTRAAALREKGQQFKVKHSRNSALKLAPAREALAMVHTISDTFAAEVAALCAFPVSEIELSKLLFAQVPDVDKQGEKLKGRSKTMADKKRDLIADTYRNNEMARAWTGTGFGWLQAVNTYEHHLGNIKGGDRVDRNMAMAVKGGFENLDISAWQLLEQVTDRKVFDRLPVAV